MYAEKTSKSGPYGTPMAGPPEAHHAATSGASPSRLNALWVSFNVTASLEYSIKISLGPTYVQI